jgi:hypothetical protein
MKRRTLLKTLASLLPSAKLFSASYWGTATSEQIPPLTEHNLEDMSGWWDIARARNAGLTPLDLYDANGDLIKRSVVGFDLDTGEIESVVFSYPNQNEYITGSTDYCGRPGSRPVIKNGRVVTLKEKLPVPLTIRQIDADTVQRRRRGNWT